MTDKSKEFIDYEKEDEPFHYFTFRNEHNIITVIIQMFLLFAGFIVIIGVIYVIFLIVVIFIHHVIFDRDATKIPSYVKNSSQFSSDEDEEDDLTVDEELSGKKLHESRSQGDDGQHRGPTAQKKAQIMEKFIGDLDHTRKMHEKYKKIDE